jgi:glycine hydroxymethyltransferase
VTIDGKNVKENVSEFMSHYTKIHYDFKGGEAYKYIEF